MAGHREPAWRRYLRLARPNRAADVDDELAFHLAAREEEFVRAGLDREAARRMAADRFGSVGDARRECLTVSRRLQRRERRTLFLEELAQDARYGLRTLWQHRAFAAAVVATLALGIGAATAMFSAVDAAMLRPLPFTRAAELVTLRSVQVPFSPDGRAAREPEDSRPDLSSVLELRDVFAGAAVFAAGGLNLTGDGDPERVRVGVVTSGFFATLGVPPALGRVFQPEEGRVGGADVAIISDGLWRRRFAAAPIANRSIALNGRAYQVVGVMPRGFSFPRQSDLWIPLSVPMTFRSFEPFRGWIPSEAVARLAPGVTAEAATQRLRAMWAGASAREREYSDGAALNPLAPLQDTLLGERRTLLLILLSATGLLLLIACANVMNLLLARAAVRRRELALRAVLGASRGRLVRQLLVESLMLSLAGAGAGILLARAGMSSVQLLTPTALRDVAPAALDLRVLGFAVALALVTGLLFGLWPAVGAARADAAETVKSGGHGATSAGAGRLRRALVTFELAIALTLLAGSVLMLRSFQAMLDTDLGFETDRVATVELTFARTPGADVDRLAAITAIVDRLRGMPGIQEAGAVNDLPLRGGTGIAISVQPEGRPAATEDASRFARYLLASEGYFRALGIRLLSGRLMTPLDDKNAPHVMVINKTMADRLWPGQEAVGRRIVEMVGGPPRPGQPTTYRTVIGVVADTRERGAEFDAAMQMYFPVHEQAPDNLAFLVRGTLPPTAMLAQLQQAIREVRPDQAVYALRMMDVVRDVSMAPRRTNTLLITGFGALAVLLAAVGVYGVVSYGVTRRVREFGIRAALGATAGDLVRLVAREGALVACIGIALGLGGAWAFSRALRSLLYGVTPGDGLTFVLAPLLLFALVMAATLIPARGAARANPVDVIRAD